MLRAEVTAAALTHATHDLVLAAPGSGNEAAILQSAHVDGPHAQASGVKVGLLLVLLVLGWFFIALVVVVAGVRYDRELVEIGL